MIEQRENAKRLVVKQFRKGEDLDVLWGHTFKDVSWLKMLQSIESKM